MMDCTKVDELLASYVLGSLEPGEASSFDRHVDSCSACTEKVSEAGGMLVELAYSVPQRRAPKRIKQRLFSRIDREERPRTERVGKWLDLIRDFSNRLALNSGTSLALGVIAVVVVAGFWYSRSLQDIEDLKVTLEAQMVSVVESEQELIEAVRQQRDLNHKIATDPDLTIKTLSATLPTVPIASDDGPAGMILVSAKETRATISAMNLPQLPLDQVYQVWLIKRGGLEFMTGTFTVDSTGYGQTDIDLSSPLGEFTAILITIERVGGSSSRTGNSVLRADL